MFLPPTPTATPAPFSDTTVPDALPQFVVVYTIDGQPYAQGQFRSGEPHDGCPFFHVHSNVTVYPFQEWFLGDVLQTTGDAPLVDPAPAQCGIGLDNALGPKRAMVPVQHFLVTCDRFEFGRITPVTDFDASRLSQLIEVCNSLRN